MVVGFGGVLPVTRPDQGALRWGALFALGNAIALSTVAIAIRKMSMTESTETLTIYQLTLLTFLTALLLPFGDHLPSAIDFFFLMLAGICNGVAQYWWTRSLHLAPPSAVVPFNYRSLVWAIIAGYVIWGDVPRYGLLIGSAIVVGSCRGARRGGGVKGCSPRWKRHARADEAKAKGGMAAAACFAPAHRRKCRCALPQRRWRASLRRM